jgi:hypothetical protein
MMFEKAWSQINTPRSMKVAHKALGQGQIGDTGPSEPTACSSFLSVGIMSRGGKRAGEFASIKLMRHGVLWDTAFCNDEPPANTAVIRFRYDTNWVYDKEELYT